MATTPKYSRKTTEAPTGFDITVTIGRVNFSQDGTINPVEAAFIDIGRDAVNLQDGDQRIYSFDPSGQNEHFMTVEVNMPQFPKPDTDPWDDAS